MEFIRETIDPYWVFNSALGLYVNVETGEEITPSEFAESHSQAHPVEVVAEIKQPTMKRLEDVELALLDLVQAFRTGNTWFEESNPNMEVGETDTGGWVSRFHLSKERISDRKFVHGAGCSNKMHPIESDKAEEHGPFPEIEDFILVMYEILSHIVKETAICGDAPELKDIMSVLSLLKMGLASDAISIGVGDEDLTSILSRLEQIKPNITAVRNRIENLSVQISNANRLRDILFEQVERDRGTKKWLRSQLLLADKKQAKLLEHIKQISDQKDKLRKKLYGKNVGRKE